MSRATPEIARQGKHTDVPAKTAVSLVPRVSLMSVVVGCLLIILFVTNKLSEWYDRKQTAKRRADEAQHRADELAKRDEERKRLADDSAKRRNDEAKGRIAEERAKIFNLVQQATEIVERNKDVIGKFCSNRIIKGFDTRRVWRRELGRATR